MEAGIVRGGKQEQRPGPKAFTALVASGVSRQIGARASELKRAGRLIARQGRKLQRGRGSVTEAGDIRPESIIWIFGAGRTGSTWLSGMMGDLEGHAVWFEPWVGALFDPNHLRLEERTGKHFILSPRYRETWLGSIKSFVLDGAGARFPEAADPNRFLVIKEPGGSAGAPLLMEAMPESRMILLVRDPRDVVASWIDAHKEGGWKGGPEKKGSSGPSARGRSRKYVKNVGEAKKAFDAHQGRKVLVRYEELRADAIGTMRRIYSSLEIPVSDETLRRVVEKHSWENIPEDEKGEGKFYRKATPGGWRDDLTPEQIKTVEKITAPLLSELYPS